MLSLNNSRFLFVQNVTEYGVEDLKPDCTYSVEVWAESEAGRGDGQYNQLEFPPLSSAHTELERGLMRSANLSYFVMVE